MCTKLATSSILGRVDRFLRRALTLCPQLCMGIQRDARFPARSADALPATLYGQFTQAIYRNRPIRPPPLVYLRVSRGLTSDATMLLATLIATRNT